MLVLESRYGTEHYSDVGYSDPHCSSSFCFIWGASAVEAQFQIRAPDPYPLLKRRTDLGTLVVLSASSSVTLIHSIYPSRLSGSYNFPSESFSTSKSFSTSIASQRKVSFNPISIILRESSSKDNSHEEDGAAQMEAAQMEAMRSSGWKLRLVLVLKWLIKEPVAIVIVPTTHRSAYLCCQRDASLDMKLAVGLVVARNERWRFPLSSPLTWK